MKNEVTDLLESLHDGRLTTEEVAEIFKKRAWPKRRTSQSASYLEMAAQETQDPEPYVPGSYDDVAAAYHRGELSDEQYSVLIDAISQSRAVEDGR